MTVVCNKFDKRIRNFSDILSFKKYDDKYVGKTGYFSDSMCMFQNLTTCVKSTLTGIDKDIGAGDYIFETEYGNYRYFLPEDTLKPIEAEKAPSKEEREKDQDRLDFCKIFLGCSSWDSNGNLQPGQWSKLDKIELPFSKERAMYLLGKFILRLDPKDNPRVDK